MQAIKMGEDKGLSAFATDWNPASRRARSPR